MHPRAKAQSKYNALSGSATKRLRVYSRSLSRDRNEYLFDAEMLRTLLRLTKKGPLVHRVRNHLRKLGFSSSKKEAKQLTEQLHRFTKPNHRNSSTNPHFQEAKSIIQRELLKAGKVRMLRYHVGGYKASLARTNTHAGFSYILTGLRSKAEYDEDQLGALYEEEVSQAKKDGCFGTPILIAYRTQGKGGFDEEGNLLGKESIKHKTRFVSIVDYVTILAENQFAGPFQDCLRRSGFYAGAYSDHDLSYELWKARKATNYWISIDYSSYDQSISDWLIYEAFDLVRGCFLDYGFDEELWTAVKTDFVKKSFIDLNGNLVYSNRGIPSGSRFTQIIGTLVNRLMILTYLIAKGFHKPDRSPMFIMGDDNIIFTDQKIDITDLSSYLNYNFGTDTHQDKFDEGTKFELPEFLSRTWSHEGADRQLEVVITKLLYPERWRDYIRSKDGVNELTTEDIIFSYCQSFPVAMEKLLSDKGQFMIDYRFNRTSASGRRPVTGLDRIRMLEKTGTGYN